MTPLQQNPTILKAWTCIFHQVSSKALKPKVQCSAANNAAKMKQRRGYWPWRPINMVASVRQAFLKLQCLYPNFLRKEKNIVSIVDKGASLRKFLFEKVAEATV